MNPCFMIDHMLIKLGKYLRIMGYDAEWHVALRTHDLIHRADREGRIFVTRNRRLADQYPMPRQCFTIRAADPVAQLGEVLDGLKLDRSVPSFTRCIRCNVPLSVLTEPDRTARDRVHPNVLRRYRQFYTCPACHTVFWKGSHVSATCAKLKLPDAGEIPSGIA